MKEAKAIVNAFFVFALYLLAYSSVVPGYVRASAGGHSPRILKMKVVNLRDGPNFTLSVPYGFIGSAIRFAALGKVRRELDITFDDTVDSARLKEVWQELTDKPEGTDVIREGEGEDLTFRREGGFLSLNVQKKNGDPEEVTLRLPWTLVESLVNEDKDLDVNAIVESIGDSGPGDLVEVKAPDAHVRIWIE